MGEVTVPGVRLKSLKPDEAGMTTHELTLPDYHPPTLNQLTRGTRRDRIALGVEVRQMVGAYCYLQKVRLATGKRRVTIIITLAKGQRAADVDAYHKGILDALRCAGLLRDDSRQWCELAPVQFERGERRMTRIVLEDLP
jgi:hypothetical protein